MRPRSITVIAWLFIAIGGIGLLASVWQLLQFALGPRNGDVVPPLPSEYIPAAISHLVSIVGGVFLLYGFSWARWILVAWLGAHVVIGFMHSPFAGWVHAALCVVIVYLLFRPREYAR